MPFAAEDAPAETFLEAIREIQPTAIIGVSAQGGAFTKECLEEMAKINERPIIFALSNPTSKAECTAEEAYTYTDARCLFACGSPFKPVEYKGKTFVPRQGNNHYVFPGIGLGAIFSRAKLIPNEVSWLVPRFLPTWSNRKIWNAAAYTCTLRSSRNFCGNRCGSCRLHLRQQSGRN